MEKDEIQSTYGSGVRWNDSKIARSDPHRPDRVYEALDNGGIFPDDLSAFVLVSMGSNEGRTEKRIAERLNENVRSPPKNKPLIVASDFYGTGDKGNFRPGFSPSHPSHEYPGVAFIRVAADAYEEWLRPSSVNVILDELGPIWHACANNDLQAVMTLFDRYRTALKPGGTLLLDEDPQRVGMSTVNMLESFGKLRVKDGIGIFPIPGFSLSRLLERVRFSSEGVIGSHKERYLLLRRM